MTDEQPPGLDEIEERFTAVLAGRITRDEADRWAARWYTDDTLTWSATALWALELLFGIDLPAGPDGSYLHPDEQIRDWLDELRRRTAQGHSAAGARTSPASRRSPMLRMDSLLGTAEARTPTPPAPPT